MLKERLKDWGRRWWKLVLYLTLFAVVPSAIAIFVALYLSSNEELQRALFTGAVTLTFGGLLGGLLKIFLDDLVAAKQKREDDAAFVSNVLTDLKSVFDRVGRAQILIPAHRSVKTYGDEMRDLIEARVQLRNVRRALNGRVERITADARTGITDEVRQMEEYLENLTSEFRAKYKGLSDKQRSYEKRAQVLVDEFARDKSARPPPELPHFVWDSIEELEMLSDFINRGPEYRLLFEKPLDRASDQLRGELARIHGGRARPS